MIGTNTLKVEIMNIGLNGIWIFVNEKEYFMPYMEFPWFKEAKVNDILNVKLSNDSHLYWPTLDIDLEIENLEHLEKYPLKYV